jgi:hypothetical protein
MIKYPKPHLPTSQKSSSDLHREQPPATALSHENLAPLALVNQILAAEAANPKANTGGFERKIDNLVYRLCDLTWEEVKVIEPEFP